MSQLVLTKPKCKFKRISEATLYKKSRKIKEQKYRWTQE